MTDPYGGSDCVGFECVNVTIQIVCAIWTMYCKFIVMLFCTDINLDFYETIVSIQIVPTGSCPRVMKI